jgi:hypothetical protein
MEEIAIPLEEPKMTPAERCYASHKKIVCAYQRRNPEKMKEKQKRYLDKLKIENPEKYEQQQQNKRDYHKRVVLPRLQREREEKLNLKNSKVIKDN